MGGHGSGTNPNSLKNLTSPAKGRAGNGAATRGAIQLSKALKRKLAEIDPDEGRLCADVLAERWYKMAKGATPNSASWKAMEAIRNTTEGYPAQAVDMTVTNKTPEEQAMSILESLQALEPESVQ
jgi:hypothetical protein